MHPSSDIIETPLRRLDRCFLGSNILAPPKDVADMRLFMREICKYLLAEITFQNDEEKLLSLLSLFPTECKNAFRRMLYGPISSEEQEVLAQLFLKLSFDNSVNNLLPECVVEQVLILIASEMNEEDFLQICNYLKQFCIEISRVLSVSRQMSLNQQPAEDVIMLLSYICRLVAEIHTKNIVADEIKPIPFSYNPARFGRAYYFTEHGMQVRSMRKFSMDDSRKKNYDDAPTMVCEKKFPNVTKSGSTYLFLWFCPKHGHCLGFHMIPGSEGRKDAHASLYCYAEVAPDVLFYDFSCSLAEYCKNRESGFFSKTRFFHDIFHGLSHKCSKVFSSARLDGLEVNTSICEQFNSYLQCIKSAGRLMSQAHFVFYVQFFIHKWNKMRAEVHKRRVEIGIKGMM